MKKIFLLSVIALSLTANAQETATNGLADVKPDFKIIELSYMDDYVQMGKWSQHWFIGVQGGASAFIGDPIGCGDLYDRTKPTWNAYLGKWITPSFGIRLALQGSQYKNSELVTTSYMLGHADLMWNIADLFRKPTENMLRWDFALYLGTGLVRGANTYTEEGRIRNFLFAATYGFWSRFNMSRRFFVSADLGGFTTFRNFDGQGKPGKLCDNMPSIFAGIGINLGTSQWKHAIEANSYIDQNEQLIDFIGQLNISNEKLQAIHNMDMKTINEFKKILRIEGLMDKYKYVFVQDSINEKNNYPGLIALKTRINQMEQQHSDARNLTKSSTTIIQKTPNVIDVPVYFFFQFGRAVLTDDAQLVNLDEIADVAKRHNLKIRVASAADSATGTEQNNGSLSIKRANYIAQQLKLRGVKEENIEEIALGGIAEHENPKENRYSKVSLYFEL